MGRRAEFCEGRSIVAKPELGSKRQCESCGSKFFDLNKNPIVCPRCGAQYQSAHGAARPAAEPDEDDEEVEAAGPEIVPLDAADDAVDGKVAPAAADDDVDVDVDLEDDDDEAADDTFLEDDDEGDDVTGLIDGDIEKDDEV